MRYLKIFITKIIDMWDWCFKSNVHGKISKIKNSWYNSYFLNSTRSVMSTLGVKLCYKFGGKNKKNLKLHLGCGEKHLEGYVNVDHRKTCATDLVCDITKLPYPENSAEVIETYHVIEHVPRHAFPVVLVSWYKILVPGGKLIIECPDFDTIVKEYSNGKQNRIDDIFGLQRFAGDAHHFGYNFKMLEGLLRKAGFIDIQKKLPQDYHAGRIISFRVECMKGIGV